MTKLLRCFLIPVCAFIFASAAAHGIVFTGNSVHKMGNMTYSYPQTYTLTGTAAAPQVLKVVTKYGSDSSNTETFTFAKKGKVTHQVLDPQGKPYFTETGTYTLKKAGTKVTITVKIKDTTTDTDTFVFSGKTLKATYSIKSGSTTYVTTFSGKQK